MKHGRRIFTLKLSHHRLFDLFPLFARGLLFSGRLSLVCAIRMLTLVAHRSSPIAEVETFSWPLGKEPRAVHSVAKGQTKQMSRSLALGQTVLVQANLNR